MKDYLNMLEKGNELFKKFEINKDMSEEEHNQLQYFLESLKILYMTSLKGKDSNINLSGNLSQDIEMFKKIYSSNDNNEYDLADRIVRMFCHFAGVDTLKEAKKLMNKTAVETNKINQGREKDEFYIQQGDFVKGLKDVKYINDILQNGALCKEFLGESANIDKTPLDTDLSKVTTTTNNVQRALEETDAKYYAKGDLAIWCIVKNNDMLYETDKNSANKYDKNKFEVFRTGVLSETHYGIRTGFPSTMIDSFIVNGNSQKLKFEIALNGIYYPIYDYNTNKNIFSVAEFNEIRSKMAGLSHYNDNEYKFSDNLLFPGIEQVTSKSDRNKEEVEFKRKVIQKIIHSVMEKHELEMKTKISDDIKSGTYGLIDTGSTGRGSNVPGDGDFDFIMKLDNGLFVSGESEIIRQELIDKLKQMNINPEAIFPEFKDIRFEKLDFGIDKLVDVDITIRGKTDKITYSTDMAINDYLSTMQKQDEKKYRMVLANIIKAKEILKQAECYKPNRGKKTQGGLGGVSVENWIIQNGGSLNDAAKNFLKMLMNVKALKNLKRNTIYLIVEKITMLHTVINMIIL